jgi:cytochrome c biogenesis factor
VENASFMPWLSGTALPFARRHQKRGAFKRVGQLLAIVAFSLSLLGVPRAIGRAKVITCIRYRPRGVFILVFLAAGGRRVLTLFAWRLASDSWHVRHCVAQSILLANNILLIIAMAGVLRDCIHCSSAHSAWARFPSDRLLRRRVLR